MEGAAAVSGSSGGPHYAVSPPAEPARPVPDGMRAPPPAPSILRLPVELLEKIVVRVEPLHRAPPGLPQILVLGSLSRLFRDVTLSRHPFWRKAGLWTELLGRSWGGRSKWNISSDTPYVVPAEFLALFAREPARVAAALSLDVPGGRILLPASLLELLAAFRDLPPGHRARLEHLTVPSLKAAKLDSALLLALADSLGPSNLARLRSFNLQNGTKFGRHMDLAPSKIPSRPFIRGDGIAAFASSLGPRMVRLGLAGLSQCPWSDLLATLARCTSLRELDIVGSCFSIHVEVAPEDGSVPPVDLAALAAALPGLKSLAIGGASILYSGGLGGFEGLDEVLFAPPLAFAAAGAGLEEEEPTGPAVRALLASIPEGRRCLRRLKFGYGDSLGPWVELLPGFPCLEEIWNAAYSDHNLGLRPLADLALFTADPDPDDPEDAEKAVSRLRRLSVVLGERVALVQADMEAACRPLARLRELVIRRDLTAAWVALGNYQANLNQLDLEALGRVLPPGCSVVVADA